jgi:hypothetical protein
VGCKDERFLLAEKQPVCAKGYFMKLIHILEGSGGKPAYIEFLKEGAASPTLLSVEKFRGRYGEEVTNELLGVETDVAEAVSEEAAETAEKSGEKPAGEGLFEFAS